MKNIILGTNRVSKLIFYSICQPTMLSMGYAEFSICCLENDNIEAEECYKRYPLTRLQKISKSGDTCTNQPDENIIIVCAGQNDDHLKAALP